MTNIELRFFESAIHFFTRRDKEIDWEQRKYEIAKEVLPTILSNKEFFIDESIELALKVADSMVEKLKAE